MTRPTETTYDKVVRDIPDEIISGTIYERTRYKMEMLKSYAGIYDAEFLFIWDAIESVERETEIKFDETWTVSQCVTYLAARLVKTIKDMEMALDEQDMMSLE